MTVVHVDTPMTDDRRRSALYSGELVVTSPDAATTAFCQFADQLVSGAFSGLDPELAQDHMPVERYVEILSSLKPSFIHHRRSKELLQAVLEARGCDTELTYFDVPRLRTSTSDGYLTSGIAYAWHPHRDTWYSAPMNQLNFWLPLYPIEAGNAMAFHPTYFAAPVPNSSATYNYYEWNSKYRGAAAGNVDAETRPLPGPTIDVDISHPLILMTSVGGLIEFSGQQLHSSIPNNTGRTRFSIDFRTVHVGDIAAGVAALNVDSACTGSSIRDFVRAADLAPMPDRIVSLFNDGSEATGDLRYSAAGEAPRKVRS